MAISASADSLNPALTQAASTTVTASVTADGTGIDASTSTGASASSSTSTSSTDGLGETDFLTLLVTQLKNQDPLSPEDSTQFLSQLAQFQSLESDQNMLKEITALDTDFKSTVTSQQDSATSLNNATSVSLIGKQVKIKASDVDWEGSTVPITVNLGSNPSATLQILNTDGTVVKTLTTTSKDSATSSTVQWDGSTDSGGTASAGSYTVKVVGQDTDSSLYTYVQDTVSGVRFTDSGAMLEIGGQEYSAKDIMNVAQDVDTGGFSNLSSSSVVEMLNKTVRVRQSTVSYTGASGENDEFKVNASPNATVNVAITDSKGTVVEEFQKTADANGVVTIDWNGQAYDGSYAQPGAYAITIDGQDNNPSLYAYTEGTVNSVSNLNGNVQLNVAGQNVSLSNVISISST